MKSLWSDAAAERAIKDYAADGVNETLALRVYTSRLLGGNPSLVLHGGGNTSCKMRATDLTGETHDVICIKGSGWDLETIEPAGLPAVKLGPLNSARSLDVMSDEDMVALQRQNLLDPSAPNPSVETLLHAYVPHRFVDHTHSTAILALIDQEDSEAICKEVFGTSMGFVPYVMPGFELSKRAAAVYESDTDVHGLILDKHGIVTFGDSARQSYERMIEKVTLAEAYIDKGKKKPFSPRRLPKQLATAVDISPALRGAVASASGGKAMHHVVDFRTSPTILAFVNGAALDDYAQRGVSTPDLSIRIKNRPLLLPPPESGAIGDYRATVREAAATYAGNYRAYFDRCNNMDDIDRTMLDPAPKLALVPGIGLFGIGRDAKDASISADVGENWIEAVTAAEKVGVFRPVSELELFKLEYWSLEQAKLANKTTRPLQGQVAIVTGGAGAIGAATAKCLAANGAHVVVADIDGELAQDVADQIKGFAHAVHCDVTDDASVCDLFESALRRFGGVDIVVSNAGGAIEGEIATLSDEQLRASFELNFFAHQRIAQHAVRVMREQGTGGVLLFNASKQAVNPGPNFGAYGLAKAATMCLSRQYALECGRHGIRSCAVNADRIRSGLLTDEMVTSRARSRGLSESEYLSGNLLGREVTAEDVAQAFLHLALAESTTGQVSSVDGGNVAAMLR